MNESTQQPEDTKQPSPGLFAPKVRFVANVVVPVCDVFALFVGAIAIFAFAARFSWAADLCCQFRVQLLMILAAATIVYWIWRRGAIAWWVLMCFVANLLPMLPYLVPNANAVADASTTAPSTRIMTLNLLQGNQHHEEVVNYITENDPDIFIAIESDQEWTEGLKPIEAIYPHRHIIDDRSTSSIAVYSRIPFDSVEVHHSSKHRLPSRFERHR